MPSSSALFFSRSKVTFLLATLLVGMAMSWRVMSATPFPIANPGFEGMYLPARECANITGVVADGWTDNTCWDSEKPRIIYARDLTNPQQGMVSQRITLVSGRRVQFAQFLSTPLQEGTKYAASIWMRSQTRMYVTVLLRRLDAPYTAYSSKLVNLTGTWARIDFDGLPRWGRTTPSL